MRKQFYNEVSMMSSFSTSPASELSGERSGPPIVVVTGTRVRSSKEPRGAHSKPSYMSVQTGDIINVM